MGDEPENEEIAEEIDGLDGFEPSLEDGFQIAMAGVGWGDNDSFPPQYGSEEAHEEGLADFAEGGNVSGCDVGCGL